MSEDNPPALWERQPHDTDKGFAAFCVYRDMGEKRSLQKAANEYYGKPSATVRYFEIWSSKHNWVDRARAYDDYVLDQVRERREAHQLRVEANVWQDYDQMRGLMERQLRNLQSEWPLDLTKISDLLALMKQLDDYVRRTLGLPDKITHSQNQNTHSGSIDHQHNLPPLEEETLAKILGDNGRSQTDTSTD